MKSMVKLYIYCRKINTVFSNIRQYTVFHEGKLHNYFQITSMKKFHVSCGHVWIYDIDIFVFPFKESASRFS